MAGVEGYRPQNKEAAFDAGQPQGAFLGGARYERSEIQYGTPKTTTRLTNGVPHDIVHLYTFHRSEDGQLCWWTERQSIASWQEEVRAGHERQDPRYEGISEENAPSTITHTSTMLYRNGEAPIYSDKSWVHLHYVHAPTRSFADPYALPLRNEEDARRLRGEQKPVLETVKKENTSGQEGATRKELDLDTARTILQTIVNTPESTITETTPLDRVGGYSTELVREAERVVAEWLTKGRFSIVDGDSKSHTVSLGASTSKETPQGNIELRLDSNLGVELMLSKNFLPLIKNSFALKDPKPEKANYFCFNDSRSNVNQYGGLAHLQRDKLSREEQLQVIKTMHRGLRWMNANMLNWDEPTAIMPEDLDHISPGSSKEEGRK